MAKKPTSKFKSTKSPKEIERISESYYYDLIVSSGEIKKLILKRIEDLEVDLDLVLKDAGISPYTFKTNYLRSTEPVSMPSLRQSHMIALLESLGIKVKITCVVRDKENVMVEHLMKNKEVLKIDTNDE